MRAAAILVAVGAFVFAADDKTDTKAKSNAEEKKAEAVERAKRADAWVEKFSQGSIPEFPNWWEVFAAFERRYGKGKVPCGTFDSAREKFYAELIRPEVLKKEVSEAGAHAEFMKATDLPTAWTWTGKRRKGCVEE